VKVVNVGKGVAGGILGTMSFIAVQHFKDVALSSIKGGRNRDYAKLVIGTAEVTVGSLALIYAIDNKGLFWRTFNLIFGIGEIVSGGKSVLEATLSLIGK